MIQEAHVTSSLAHPLTPARRTTRRTSQNVSVAASLRAQRVGNPGSIQSSLPTTQRRAQVSANRDLTLIYLEELLRSLRGEPLLIAALAYGLAVPVSALREVRVRDVAIFDRTIVIAGYERRIPERIVDDLREFLQERVCGCEAFEGVDPLSSVSSRFTQATTNFRSLANHNNSTRVPHFFGGPSIQNDPLFSEAALLVLEEHSAALVQCMQLHDKETKTRKICVNFDLHLKMLGRLHKRRALLRDSLCASVLNLFDKGPRIVRRRRGGIVDAYYLWRASRELSYR
jgi:hypothetical protein